MNSWATDGFSFDCALGASLAELRRPRGVVGGMMRLALAMAALSVGPTAAPARVAPDLFMRVIRPAHPRFRACYEAGLARTPTLAGRIAVRLVIGPSGTVLSAGRHDATTLPDTRVVACVLGVFASLRFPAPERAVTAVYPLEFSPPRSESGA